MVSTESTATVIRDPRVEATMVWRRRTSTTSLASRRSVPRPTAAMPTTSAGVAQQKASWPAASSRLARAVDLNAFTWGRSARPGRWAAMVATLASNVGPSTTRHGVGRSWIRTPTF
jgi:hypothetical protein